MCDPISLIGLALTAGGSVVQGMAARDAEQARASALSAERTRQQGLEQRQTALSNQSQQEMANFGQDQAQRTSDLTQYYQEPVPGDANAASGVVAPEGTSSIAVREMAKQSGQATERGNQDAANLASLRSFGDLLGERMRGVQRTSGNIDQLTGFRRGSNDALAYELDAAQQQGAGKRLIGDILGGAGSIVGGYGAMAGAGTPAVTGLMDRFGMGDDLAGALRRVPGVRNVQSVRTGLLG